jgi:ABC-type multidrug transport system ATPase subunit
MLEITNIWAGYGRGPILKGVSLEIRNKVVLLGPNGSGKTTLVRTILGLLRLKSGSIKIFGREIEDVQGETRFSTNYQFVYSLFLISINDLIDLYMHLKGGDVEYARNLIQDFKLDSVLNKKLHQLSAGQRTLVCNILAIASNPELLVLDEPFESVDPARVRKIISLIQEYKGKLLLITHQLPLLQHFPDYSLYFIFEGKVSSALKPLKKIIDTYVHLKSVETPILALEVGGRTIYLSEKPGDYKLKDFIDLTKIYEVVV